MALLLEFFEELKLNRTMDNSFMRQISHIEAGIRPAFLELSIFRKSVVHKIVARYPENAG